MRKTFGPEHVMRRWVAELFNQLRDEALSGEGLLRRFLKE
jgi:hypothetical protein